MNVQRVIAYKVDDRVFDSEAAADRHMAREALRTVPGLNSDIIDHLIVHADEIRRALGHMVGAKDGRRFEADDQKIIRALGGL